MTQHETKPALYALLIGIDHYRGDIIVEGARFAKLRGCVNDALAVHGQLLKEKDFALKVLALHNQQATKTAICEAFENHLSNATKKDVVFIYYSGHGTCEYADTNIWKDQSNGRLEALVCYYDYDHAPSFLLTSKEIRYLINYLYKKTEAHIVTVFDCCHSGDNTRNARFNKGQEKKVDFIFPKREWKDFIFSKNISEKDFENKSVSEVLPQGKHVQMSAAESDEPAIELAGKGVFTKHLLETWRMANGKLTYRDMHARVRNQMRGLYEQKPKLFAPVKYGSILQGGFLNNKKPGPLKGVVIFNKHKNLWVLNKGILNGVVAGQTEVKLSINDLPPVKVQESLLDHAFVDLFSENQLDVLLPYDVGLNGLRKKHLKITVTNNGGNVHHLQRIFDDVFSAKFSDVRLLVDEPKDANFELVLNDGFVIWKRPEKNAKPLVRPQQIEFPALTDSLNNQLNHLLEWECLKELKNNGENKLPEKLLQVEFFQIKNRKEKNINPKNKNQFAINLDKIGEEEYEWGGMLKIKVTNNHSKNIYVAGVYLSEDFSAQPILFEPSVKMIEPGKSEWVLEYAGGQIPLQLDPKWYYYNWEKAVDTLKFIYSTEDFNSDELLIEALPGPVFPGEEGEHRGGFRFFKKPAFKGWNCFNYDLIFPNPTFNKFNSVKLEKFKRYLDTYNHPDEIQWKITLTLLEEIYSGM